MTPSEIIEEEISVASLFFSSVYPENSDQSHLREQRHEMLHKIF